MIILGEDPFRSLAKLDLVPNYRIVQEIKVQLAQDFLLNLFEALLAKFVEAINKFPNAFLDFDLKEGVNSFPEVLMTHDILSLKELVILSLKEVFLFIVNQASYCVVLKRLAAKSFGRNINGLVDIIPASLSSIR